MDPEQPCPRVAAMIEHYGAEVPAAYPDREAESAWACASALWHPLILARCDGLPKVAGVEFPDVPEPGEVRVVAEGASRLLPPDYRSIAADSGAKVLDGGIDRATIARDVLAAIDGSDHPAVALDDPLVLDFLALGTARWFLDDLTRAMNHAECLDVASLAREANTGAKAWRDGDRTAASGHLRAAFELLTQAREKFYPVEAYLVDLCLIDPSFPPGAIADALAARAAVTFVGSARAVERLAEIDPDRIEQLRRAIEEGWADVAGGTYDEADEVLLPFGSIVWQFLKGGEVYRKHLDDRNVEALATRRFALYPSRPQIARKFGFRYAVHLGLDAGKFPVPRETKRLWEAPDSSHLESLTRPPLAADRASDGLRLPWRIGRSMRDDHVATVPLAHWPSPLSGWYRDLRRSSAYSPVLSRWVTLGDYFHMSDRPWEMFGPTLDEYVTPYLAQAIVRRDAGPISKRSDHHRLRARIDALSNLDALRRALTHVDLGAPDESWSRGPMATDDLPFPDAEVSLESGKHAKAAALVEPLWDRATKGLADALIAGSSGGEPGFLVLNPFGILRRAAVEVADPSADPRPGGPLRSVERTESGFRAVVDLPPFGFAWFARNGAASAGGVATAKADGRVVGNESIEAEFDEATGGLRAIRSPGEPTPRLGQQIVVSGLVDADGNPVVSRMEARSVELVESGPTVAAIASSGVLVHPTDSRTLATFRQTARVWAGRPTLDLSIHVEPTDSDWLASLSVRDPWTHHVACRWAWPDGSASLRRVSLFAGVATTSPRPETPFAFEVTSRKLRATILFGGLAHHKRHGERMLDTLLIAGRETARDFALGVALDREHAFHAVTDFLAPSAVVATKGGPPGAGPTGWLVLAESPGVHVARLEFLERTGDGRGWGLAATLAETAGRGVRSRLRLFRDPIDARLTDFAGDLMYDLPTEGDAVPFDLSPYEMCRIEVRLG